MKRMSFLLLFAMLLFSCNPAGNAVKNDVAEKSAEQASVQAVPQRSDIAEEYRWNLKDLYETPEAWDADYDMVSERIPELAEFKGQVAGSPDAVADYFALSELLGKKVGRMYVYAGLKKDEDTRISENQARMTRIASLNNEMGENTSFFETELLTVPEETLRSWFSSHEGLKDYQHWLDDLLRQQAHVLSDTEESLLAKLGNFSNTPDNIQEAIKYADMKFPKIDDGKGNMIQLTPGRYYQLLLQPDQDLRRRAFEARNGAFNNVINTSAATYNAQLQMDLFYTKARAYESTLQRKLSYDNVPMEVYENLVETVSSNLEPLHRYYALKKKVLGLEEMHLYDTALPIVPEADMEVKYEEAKANILKALEPLGEEYVSTVNKAFDGRWIDVYETEGKSGGAYSWGTFDAPHPYIMMNYNDTQDHMFTLAHELGHTMHSYYSKKTQPYAMADYTLFVAEVASTFNENLLMRYLLDNAESDTERMILLDQWISNIEGTVITQVQFAEFEQRAHTMAQAGEPITVDALNAVYHEILEKYNGPEMVIDPLYDITWARIPHFFRSFYVYKYATSLCASTSLAKDVLNDNEGSKENYMNFLASGGSEYPIDLLKKAGVDMSSPAPIEETMKFLGELVAELEELLL